MKLIRHDSQGLPNTCEERKAAREQFVPCTCYRVTVHMLPRSNNCQQQYYTGGMMQSYLEGGSC